MLSPQSIVSLSRGFSRGVCTPAPAANAIRALYRRGSGRRKTGPGQPRVVAIVTGGGGSLISWLLAEPGASSCILEARVPYGKESLSGFLAEHDRTIDGVGFCSAGMAARMAEAARDRAISLTPVINQWPDAIGVASTATIVSHYARRGDYRVHAATCTGDEAGVTTYTHTFIKGARERSGEDAACALLTLRALAEAAGLENAPALAACGLRTEDTPAKNAVGEVASGIEELPHAEPSPPSPAAASAPRVLIPRPSSPAGHVAVPLPLHGALPPGTIVVPSDDADHGRQVARATSEALSALGRHGDGGDGAWSVPQAPVLLEAPSTSGAAKYLHHIADAATAAQLTNWAILVPSEGSDATSSSAAPSSSIDMPPPRSLRALSGALPRGATVLLSAPAAHDLIACVLAHWESGDGIAALSEFAAAGGRLVVARGTDTIGTEMELAVVDSVGELPRELRSTFTFVSEHFHDGRVNGLCDGSPSTEGVGGEYTGGWDTSEGRPEGRGVMRWANGISYDGLWSAGKYDGHGIKSYSKGGGYSGMWREGKRHGFGTSLYDGKWGYARWVGPFEDDKPHGVGTMYLHDGAAGGEGGSKPFEFVNGEPVERE